VSDGALELGGAGGGYEDRRRELSEMTRRARAIDDVVAGLALDETTGLSDDVALLFLRREDTDV
jgi:hypothetical protein